MAANLEREGLDIANVTSWVGRPKRQLGQPPKTYWDEYVATDTWYVKKLTEDVPDEEMHAACVDEEFDNDEGEEEEEEEELDEEEEDLEYISSNTTDSSDGEIDTDPEEEEDSDDCTDDYATPPRQTSGSKEEVYRTPERE
jgi:hypothetical protein